MKESGINSNRKNRYVLNEDYFEKIDSPNKAYILGFIYADGYVGDSKHNNLVISVKDFSILSFIKSELNYTGMIKETQKGGFEGSTPGYAIRISSAKLTSDLRKLGLFPNKSTALMCLPSIPDEYLSHFIRGYFDGDGWVSISKRKPYPGNGKQYKNINTGFLGTEPFLKDAIEKINSNSEEQLPFKIYNTQTKEIKSWQLSSKKDAFVFYNFLYNKNTFCLERKKKKFDIFFSGVL